jgi:catalase
MAKKKLTTAAGRPYVENEDSMTAGPRGPVLLQDYYLHEKLAHFNRERIPERVVHAKGTGVYGKFTVTKDITKFTRAKLFSKVGNSCRVLVRFSTVGGEKGSADTERDPRGFAVKFYTEDGNWDLVGNNTLTGPQADAIRGIDPDYSQRDLVEAIGKGDFPKWTLKIQVMTDEQAKKFKWNPFDVTKIWPHKEFPLIEAGVMELNKIPENYFAEVEQAAFAPAHTVNGIGLSPDKMLQGRIFAYPDAHRYRLGANYLQIPVNRPIVPVHNHERDGFMSVDGNGGPAENYYPNSFDTIEADKNYKEAAMALESNMADYYDRNKDDNDYYTQPGALFRKVMTDQERQNTVNNFVGALKGVKGPKKKEIIMRQLGHFHKADKELAVLVAKGLGVKYPAK